MTRRHLVSLDEGLWIRRNPETKYIVNEEMLEKAWELIVNTDEVAEFDRFLMAVSHILRSFENDLCTNVDQIERFRNVNNYNDLGKSFELCFFS